MCDGFTTQRIQPSLFAARLLQCARNQDSRNQNKIGPAVGPPRAGAFLRCIFYLKKAFDAMDRERCLLILEGYGVGPNMIRLIRNFWRDAVLVCRASGNYSTCFQSGRDVTQGGPLSAKLFNILVDAVVREWYRQLGEESELEEEAITELMATLFAIFYVDDAYLASRDPTFLQRAVTILVNLLRTCRS